MYYWINSICKSRKILRRNPHLCSRMFWNLCDYQCNFEWSMTRNWVLTFNIDILFLGGEFIGLALSVAILQSEQWTRHGYKHAKWSGQRENQKRFVSCLVWRTTWRFMLLEVQTIAQKWLPHCGQLFLGHSPNSVDVMLRNHDKITKLSSFLHHVARSLTHSLRYAEGLIGWWLLRTSGVSQPLLYPDSPLSNRFQCNTRPKRQ